MKSFNCHWKLFNDALTTTPAQPLPCNHINKRERNIYDVINLSCWVFNSKWKEITLSQQTGYIRANGKIYADLNRSHPTLKKPCLWQRWLAACMPLDIIFVTKATVWMSSIIKLTSSGDNAGRWLLICCWATTLLPADLLSDERHMQASPDRGGILVQRTFWQLWHVSYLSAVTSTILQCYSKCPPNSKCHTHFTAINLLLFSLTVSAWCHCTTRHQ